ncbi:MAG: FeoA domain-containing protein [Armatimonadetes bacterium]|nr:FeoA domain-containing protein [Armatimonadota bacterium]
MKKKEALSENCDCIAFCKLKKGVCARILGIEGSSDLACRLQEMGLVQGTELMIEKVAPLGDPVEISFRGQHLCLRKNEASCIQVEIIR